MIAPLVALALVGCAPAPPGAGALVRDGRVWGEARRDDAPDGVTWTLAVDGVTTVERATLDVDGRLAAYEARRDDGTAVTLAADGRWTATTFGAVAGSGRLDLPAAPLWLPAGGVALRAWSPGARELVWDGHRVVDADLVVRAEGPDGLRLRVAAADAAWDVVLDVAGRVTARTWPDGTAWRAGVGSDLPRVVRADLVHPTVALPEARRLRRLVVRLPDGRTATTDRPLWEELPALPPGGLAPADPRAVPDVPAVPLALPPGLDRRALVAAAFDAVVAGRAGSDDCKALAWRLAAGLRAADVDAEVVTGLVHQADPTPRFVHHAWVRVPFGDLVLDVDPALGQRVADATHLDGLGELAPGAPIEVLEAVGPAGPVAIGP